MDAATDPARMTLDPVPAPSAAQAPVAPPLVAVLEPARPADTGALEIVKAAGALLPIAAVGGAVAVGVGIAVAAFGMRALSRALAKADREDDEREYAEARRRAFGD